MSDLSAQHLNYQKIRKVIELLSENYKSQPCLNDLAKTVGMSPFHLQRTFNQWAGVSPKQFIGFLTKEYAKSKLKESSVMHAAISSGLSGGGRLHDLLVSCDAVTPGEFKSQGAGLFIEYGVHQTPFGFCLLATTNRGVCHLSFFDVESDSAEHLSELQKNWLNAKIVENHVITANIVTNIFTDRLEGATSIKVLLHGSPFKLKVWEALLKTPPGSLFSYQQVANQIGMNQACRAVASAVASNQVGFLIPCHRVIRNTGVLNNYRWGGDRKAALIGWESSLTL